MLYVIQVRTTEEHKIQETLRTWVLREGEEAFVPTYELQKFFHGEERMIKKALFPGYVFCRTDDIDGLFYRLKRIPHLTRILRPDINVSEFGAVTAAEEARLNAMGGPEHNVGASIGVIENGQVKILSGPLMDYTGRFYRIDRHKRTATIGIEIAGVEHRVPVALEIISKK